MLINRVNLTCKRACLTMQRHLHRTLLYGGIFGYPGDKKNPNGKLRLLYEAAPVSYIVEQAGGKSTTGKERIMDIVPTGVRECYCTQVPVLLCALHGVNVCATLVYRLYAHTCLKAVCVLAHFW
jgi:fructose-1,6-bisphosphatase